METGRTVILLNMEKLYESLYDALNQVRTSWISIRSYAYESSPTKRYKNI